MADREFLFNYRFAGADWGISIYAADAAEAREKIKAVGMARYEGEIHQTIRVRGKWLVRLLTWFYRQ